MGWRSQWLLALSAMLTAVPAAAAESADETPAGAANIAPWLQRISDKVQAQFSAASDAPSGASATLEVWLLTDGKIWSMRLVRTSGSTPYELAARHAVTSAQPLPTPEEPATLEHMRIVTLEFENRSAKAVRGEPKRTFAATPATQVPLSELPCVQTGLKADAAAHCDRVSRWQDKVDCFFMTWQQRIGQIVASCGDSAYPPNARQRLLEGTAHVLITYDKHATLQAIEVRESSGQTTLDQRALELVRLSQVDPPKTLRGEGFTGRMPIVFKFRRLACVSGQEPGCTAGGDRLPGPAAR